MNTILPNIKSKTTSKDHSEDVKSLIDLLATEHVLSREEYLFLLDHITILDTTHLFQAAYQAKQPYYQNRVYLRGLIEISNYCKRGCHYCGIHRTNQNVRRYRLTKEEILSCCESGYTLGYRTFVLQGGEDPELTDTFLIDIIQSIKKQYPDTRITLSVGERSYSSYQALYNAGADRYLLRHEAASKRLYEYLHPEDSSYENRIQCLFNLQEIGYQTGAGFMVGSPSQTNQDLVEDILFLQTLKPDMIGIGPFLPHMDTRFFNQSPGTLLETYILLAIVRLAIPHTMLPATTALGSLDIDGRERALFVGANVVMPNISPKEHLAKYEIYPNKPYALDTDEHNRNTTVNRIYEHHHQADFSVGDVYAWKGHTHD
jgi:biotin synthase